MAEFGESGFDALPSTWEVKRLDQIADLLSGGTPSKAKTDWWKGTIPWVSPKDMKVPRLLDVSDHISEEAAERGSRVVPAKTIFLVVRGMILARNVPVAIAERPMAFNQDMKAIIAHQGVNPDFLLYAIRHRTPALASEISTSAHGTRRMGSLAVESLRVALPRDQREQHRIVDILTRLEDAVAVQTRAVAALKELKAATMAKLFREGLRGEATKDTEIGIVPASWEVQSLRDCCGKPQYGHTATATRDVVGPRFLRITDIAEHGVDWQAVPYCECEHAREPGLQLADGDLVFARIGATTGKSYLVENPPRSVFASYLIRLRPGPSVLPRYLAAFCESDAYWRQVNANKDSNLKGGFSGSVLSTFRLPVPSRVEDQQAIGEMFAGMNGRIRCAASMREARATLLAATLRALMSGDVRVTPLLEA